MLVGWTPPPTGMVTSSFRTPCLLHNVRGHAIFPNEGRCPTNVRNACVHMCINLSTHIHVPTHQKADLFQNCFLAKRQKPFHLQKNGEKSRFTVGKTAKKPFSEPFCRQKKNRRKNRGAVRKTAKNPFCQPNIRKMAKQPKSLNETHTGGNTVHVHMHIHIPIKIYSNAHKYISFFRFSAR